MNEPRARPRAAWGHRLRHAWPGSRFIQPYPSLTCLICTNRIRQDLSASTALILILTRFNSIEMFPLLCCSCFWNDYFEYWSSVDQWLGINCRSHVCCLFCVCLLHTRWRPVPWVIPVMIYWFWFSPIPPPPS